MSPQMGVYTKQDADVDIAVETVARVAADAAEVIARAAADAAHTANPEAHHAFGGLYGINVENLTGDKTLTAGVDPIYQYLNVYGTVTRDVNLDTASARAGDRFVICNYSPDWDHELYLWVKVGGVSKDRIYCNGIKQFVFTGTEWAYDGNIGGMFISSPIHLGPSARANKYGVAIGYFTRAEEYGVALGYQAQGYSYGVGVGYQAQNAGKKYSQAFGYNSKCTRTAETSVNIDGDSSQYNNVVQGRWKGSTANGTPLAILCGGIAAQRFIIRASSALAFRITVVARDNVAGHVAMYTFEGVIKRDAANNTVLSVVNKTIIHEDDATWDCDVTADDTNEALIITVTGDATNPVQWAAVLDGVETHF